MPCFSPEFRGTRGVVRRADLEAIARWCGYPAGSARALEEDYLRQTRNARKVYERLFFDEA